MIFDRIVRRASKPSGFVTSLQSERTLIDSDLEFLGDLVGISIPLKRLQYYSPITVRQ